MFLKPTIASTRVGPSVPFVDVLREPLPFKIPILLEDYVIKYPNVFVLGRAEYATSVDTWLEHQLLSYTSEQAVVILDGLWQGCLKELSFLTVLLDEHDFSSKAKLRPDFTGVANNVLVIKGEAKATMKDMNENANDLVSKFHKTAYKSFPQGCNSIPAVTTCNEAISLYSIAYFNKKFTMARVKDYRVSSLEGRVEFIVDIFKILRWIVSQTEPVEKFHLVTGVRVATRNGHHITLTADGIVKEFNHHQLERIPFAIIKEIYANKLPNVEHGVTNCRSITITRVGSKLRDALVVRHLDKRAIYQQVASAVEQLHSIGYAHCDICVDNIFADAVEDGGSIFLGDLEYCCVKTQPPPTSIRRASANARTAEELDNIQLSCFADELAML